MSFGYPGDNLHLEHHGVSEESFWPSFTDIMMVIVMVFLLVTIAVILNNWTLIADLKESVAKQQLASHIADDKEVENISLEAKLTYLEKQLALFKEKTATEQEKVANAQAALSKEKEALASTQSELSKSQATVAELNALSSKQKAAIEATEKSLLVAQNTLEDKDKQITSLTEQRDKNDKILENKLLALSLMKNSKASLKVKVDNLKTELTTAINKMAVLTQSNEKLQSKKIATNDLQAKLQLANKQNEEKDEALVRLQSEQERVKTELASLKSKADIASKESAQANKDAQANKNAQSKIAEIKEELIIANKKVTASEEKLALVNKKLAEIESDSDVDSDVEDESNSDKISDLESAISKKDDVIKSLKKRQSEVESQLVSLQGEYDTLDTKYQKLLRPARSSKGKYIVSVTYKKIGGKKTIRLKSGPKASYKTVSKREMAKALEKLKKKHKSDLYVKIIIPEKSGLSYNEAWRFTTNLQQKYDYYFQPDSGSKSKKSSKKNSKK